MKRYKEIGDRFILIPARTAIGFIKIDGECYMIDSGLDKDQARRAINIARELSLTIKAVLNTHSHADHIGGNKFTAERLEIHVYGDKRELPYITHPILEAILLYGGHPTKDFRNKFFMAQPVDAKDISQLQLPFEIIDLSGHSPGMIGFKVDNVLYCADAYFPIEILKRHVIPYTYDPRKAYETLKTLMNMTNLILVPAHGEPHKDPTIDIEANMNAIEKVKTKLIEIITGEITFEEIAHRLFSSLNIDIHGVGLYHLYLSIIRGYLTWLQDENYISPTIKNRKLYWVAIKR